MLTIIIILLAVIYMLFLVNAKTKIMFSPSITIGLRLVHILLLVIFIALMFLMDRHIYLRGFYTNKIFIWLFVFSAMLLFVFGRKQMQHKLERFYYGLFIYVPLFCIPIFIIPFIGWGFAAIVYCFTIVDAADIKYNSSTYRLQTIHKGFLEPASMPRLFVKRGVFEYEQKPIPRKYSVWFRDFSVQEVSPNNVKITFYHDVDWYEAPSPDTFYVHIDN